MRENLPSQKKERTKETLTANNGLVLKLMNYFSVAVLSLSALATGCSEQKKTPIAKPIISEPIIMNKNEVTLGNITFEITDSPNITEKEKQEILNNFQKAYDMLKCYFGEELMKMETKKECKIVCKQIGKNLVIDKDVGIALDEKGEHYASQIKEKEPIIILGETDLYTILHELFHYFVQKAPFLSEAFHEGHAHAVQALFQGEEGFVNQREQFNPDFANELYEGEKLEKIFKGFGLDYTKLDEGKGLQEDDENLKSMAIEIIRKKWSQFMAKNPEYLKNFYSEINKQYKEGKLSFTKSELIEISGKVSPQFEEWYEKEDNFNFLGEGKTKGIIEYVVLPKSEYIVIFNIYGVRQHVAKNQLIFRQIIPALNDKIMPSDQVVIHAKEPSGFAKKKTLSPHAPKLMSIQPKTNPDDQIKLFIGNTEVPAHQF